MLIHYRITLETGDPQDDTPGRIEVTLSHNTKVDPNTLAIVKQRLIEALVAPSSSITLSEW